MAVKTVAVKMTLDAGQPVDEVNELNESLVNTEDIISDIGASSKKLDPLEKKFTDLNKRVESGEMSLREMSKATKEYMTIALQAGEESPIGKAALEQAGQLKDRLGDLRGAVDGLSQDGRALQTSLQLGQGVLAGYSAFQGIVALVGEENENLAKTMMKLQAAQSALMGVEQLHASLQKETLLRKKLDAIATNAQTAAQAAYSAVIGTSTGALKAFKIALIGTGIGAILVGLGLLIANFDKVTAFVKKAIAEFGNLKTVMLLLLGPIGWVILAYQKLFSEEAKMASAREKASRQLTENYNKEVAQLKEKRRIEQESFKEKQTEFDLNIARLKAEGKSVYELTTQKLEAIVAEKKAALQLNKDLIEAMVERYTLEAQLRGKSLDDFLKSIGLNKEATEQSIKDQLKAQEDAVFSAETDLIAFRNEASKGVKAPVEFVFPEPEEIKEQTDKAWGSILDSWNGHGPINIAEKFEVEEETFELIPEEEIDTALEKVGAFFAQLKMYRETGSENIKAELTESLKATQEFAEQALSTLESINDFANQISENKVNKIQKDAKRQLAVEGLTAKQRYDIELKAAKATDEIHRKAFKRDKALRLADAVMATAAATVNALASAPPPANFVLAGLVGTAGAAQIAAIAAQKFEGSVGNISPPDFSAAASSMGNGGNGGSGSQQSGQTGDANQGVETNIGKLLGQEIKVIMVETDVTETVDKVAQIKEMSTL